MINKALRFISDVLNQFIKTRFGADENKVILNGLVDTGGSALPANLNKLVITLINIEKETNKQFYMSRQQLPSGGYALLQPEERYNLDILISAAFEDYQEALKFLNTALAFFQSRPVLDTHEFPSLPEGLGKLELELEKINYQQMQGLWTSMGAKYQPSVIYKMRLLSLQADEPAEFIPEIKTISTPVTV